MRMEAAGTGPSLHTSAQHSHAGASLALKPLQQDNKQGLHRQEGSHGASEALKAQLQDSPSPKLSAPEQPQLPSAGHGSAEGASQQHEALHQELRAEESILLKGPQVGAQRGGGASSSALGSLPSIANLPKISSQDSGLQVGCSILFSTSAWAELSLLNHA